jgi:hypothetical protein
VGAGSERLRKSESGRQRRRSSDTCTSVADVNGDCAIDVLDFADLVNQVMTSDLAPIPQVCESSPVEPCQLYEQHFLIAHFVLLQDGTSINQASLAGAQNILRTTSQGGCFVSALHVSFLLSFEIAFLNGPL